MMTLHVVKINLPASSAGIDHGIRFARIDRAGQIIGVYGADYLDRKNLRPKDVRFVVGRRILRRSSIRSKKGRKMFVKGYNTLRQG